MVIHKYSHVVHNVFQYVFTHHFHCMRLNFDTDWFNNSKWVLCYNPSENYLFLNVTNTLGSNVPSSRIQKRCSPWGSNSIRTLMLYHYTNAIL